MSWASEFVELDKTIHDRNTFDCGKPELNDFIRTKASKHMAAGVSKTLLLPAANPLLDGKYPICAFYTIAASTISRETLPTNRLPHYPVPVFLLAQLAVNVDYQGQGLGKITLVNALSNLCNVYQHMRAYAIIVDCIDEEAGSFYSKYSFEELCNHNGRARMYLPMKTARQLF